MRKQIYIAHRGNRTGKHPEMENKPEYIYQALQEGYHAEIDAWYIHDQNQWYLGHDAPQYPISVSFLQDNRLWVHAKTLDTLTELIRYKDTIHFFSHEGDPVVLTSRCIPWVYPSKPINHACIAVMPEDAGDAYTSFQLQECLGICSDIIQQFRLQGE